MFPSPGLLENAFEELPKGRQLPQSTQERLRMSGLTLSCCGGRKREGGGGGREGERERERERGWGERRGEREGER